jgi:hypothetical protein
LGDLSFSRFARLGGRDVDRSFEQLALVEHRTGAYECDEVRFAITVGCRVSCRKVNATTS